MRRVLILLLAAALTVSACGSSPSQGNKVSVVASTSAWGSVAAAVGGGFVDVRSIIDNPAEDPHSYEATPGDAAAIGDAQLVVYNGGGYDKFVETVLQQHSGVKQVSAFTVGAHQQGSNPHVFYDLNTVSATTGAIADQLASIDPTHAADYRANAQKFIDQVHGIAALERGIATAHPGASAIATEDVPQYLEAATGLTDKTPEGYYKAVDADADPAPADIAAVLDLVNSRSVQVLLFNPQTDTPVTRRIVDAANAAGIPVVEVRETLPAGKDFLGWQRQTVDQLGAALQRIDNRKS
jgi:zinc/manganese transport system substrate-binding protein